MNIVTFISASGAAGVIWPAPNAQLPGEADAAFLARITSLSLPAGATNVQTIDAASYVAPTPAPPQPTPRQWLERLSGDKQAALAAAIRANDTLFWWFMRASGSTVIDVTLTETIAGVGALVTAGVLTAEDQRALLAP